MNGLEALEKLPKWLDDEHRDSEEEYFKASEEYKAIEKELKAFEIIRDFVKDMMKCVDIIPPSQGGGTKVLVSSEDFEYIYECKNQEEADLFGEVMK